MPNSWDIKLQISTVMCAVTFFFIKMGFIKVLKVSVLGPTYSIYSSIYTEQKYKCNTFVFTSLSKKKSFSTYTTGIFLSNYVQSVSERLSFVKIIHPPDRCGTSD